MASETTGFVSTLRERLNRARDHRFSMEHVRLAAAFQGLALSLAALVVVGTLGANDDGASVSVGLDHGDGPAVPTAWQPRLPTDLRRERLPVPRIPERNERAQPRTAAAHDENNDRSETPSDRSTSALAALRVTRVTYQAPIHVAAAVETSDAPSQISEGTISLTGFGESVRSTRGRGRGIDGAGIGLGGFGLGGGECSQGSQRFPGIIERSRQIVPY